MARSHSEVHQINIVPIKCFAVGIYFGKVVKLTPVHKAGIETLTFRILVVAVTKSSSQS